MDFNKLFSEIPELCSGKLEIHSICENDFNQLYDIYSNKNVFELCGIIPKKNKETVKKMIGHFERDFNKRRNIKFGIFQKTNPEILVGIIEIMDINQKVNMVTIGYFLNETFWNKGIAQEAVGIIIEFLFKVINVNRIQAEVMPRNEYSKKVLINNGFSHEGTLREATIWSGKGVVDLDIFSILKKEYTT